MKNIKLNIGLRIIVFSLFVLSGCNNEEFLSLKTPLEKDWQTLGEFDKAPIGTYRRSFLSDWHNLHTTSVLLKSFQSDEAFLLPGTIGNIPFNEMYTRQSTQPIDKSRYIFGIAYQVIATCNAGLDYIKDNDGNPYKGLSDSDIENNLRRIEGELYFMRAFSYYRLSQVFLPPYEKSGSNDDKILPWKISLEENTEAQISTELATTQMVYDQMVEDLQKAKNLLPEKYMEGVHFHSYQYGRATKYAAAALLGKVLFAMQQNTEAIDELSFVIESNQFSLPADPLSTFQYYSTPNGGPESIWYAYTGNTTLGGWQMAELTSICLQQPNTGNFARVSWNQLAFSYSMLEEIGWMEDPLNGDYTLTPEAIADKRVGSVYTLTTGKDPFADVTTPLLWCDKYFNGDVAKGIPGQNLNIPIIRLAELYLTRSWLRFQEGDLDGATKDLNQVRNRAGIGDLPGTITEKAIINERTKELFMEGDRTDFLRAAHLPIPPGDRVGVSDLPYNTPRLIWSLPLQETELNQAFRD
ncbi:MAG: RagB/SusD family nutrient uptake outer membrane protein [Cyclobacteriaceae bacterium]|nr:RagB/SusD family nutrient uptake outer membrane protein [Cyclobacteriaceae bacterium]